MKQIFLLPSRFILALSLVLVVVSGCRTYGGYDSEEIIYQQIEESNQVFANDLEKARGELQKIQQAAQSDAALSPFVEDYEMLLEKHAHLVESHAELTQTLEVKTGFIGQLTSSYRDLNRALGNIAEDQSAMKGHYYQLAARIEGAPSAEGDIWASNISRSRYQAVPPFYLAISHAFNRKSVSTVLSQSM